MTDVPVVQACDLKVRFPARNQPVTALNGVDLEIPTGALFVLLGPNGAGKTTLMRCITGLIKPTAGTISVFGTGELSSHSNRLSRLGVLIENPGLYGRMDANAYLNFFGAFYTIPDLAFRIKELCQEFDLVLNEKPVAKLSQGNRQKLQLIRTLLHRPEFLLWDEPTDHLDPVSQKQVLQYLRRYLKETGATALVATHRLEQMESVASHFGFLVQGKLVSSGPSDTILGEGSDSERVKLGFLQAPAKEIWQGMAEEFGIKIEIDSPLKSVIIQSHGLQERLPALIGEIVKRGLPLVSVEPIKPSLADIYERWVRI